MKFRIVHDPEVESPLLLERRGRFVFKSNRYVSGDENVSDPVARASDFDVVIPVWAYIHSGVTIWTTGGEEPCIPGEHRGWDTGCIGFIVADLNGEDPDVVGDILRSEVRLLNQWLTGDVWRYEIVESCETCEDDECYADDSGYNVTDCCGGFFGRDEAVEAAKHAGGTEEING